MTKKLYKSRDNRVLAGVLGGVGEYFDIDPVLVRLVYLVIMLGTGVVPGAVVYVIAMFVVPQKPVVVVSNDAPSA